ncbi:MAG: hypothetical protein WCI22_11940 [Actinomycetota bacterium]
MNRPTLLTIIGAPLLMLVAGGAIGRSTRTDDHGAGNTTARIGVPLPLGASLEAYAPVRPLASAPHHVVYDPTDIVGYQPPHAIEVPKGAALPLDGTPLAPVDLSTLRPAVSRPTSSTPTDATPITALTSPATPPSTLAPPVQSTAPTTAAAVRSQFVDPCLVASSACVGVAAEVRRSAERAPNQLDPLQMTLPFAAAHRVASLCNTVEQPTGVPDAHLPPAMRPTIGVVVNQPSTIALTGTWSDGSPLEKLTMVTLPAFDAQWQSTLATDHRQRGILACVTLPLDTVRAHANGGRTRLVAHLLAIGATGRSEIEGSVDLDVPLDGDDLRFVDQLRFGDLGLQRQHDGTLAPTVHVHYAFTSDTMVPAGQLDPGTTRVYDRHALVENADCSGWANNQQGLDRTASSDYSITRERRTVSGRERPITVVDGDIRLDPAMAAGWQGYLCTQIVAADHAGNRETLVLRGAQVRSPLTPQYRIGVAVDDVSFPSGDHLSLTFTRNDGQPVCNTSVQAPGYSSGSKGAQCALQATAAPDGLTVTVHVVDAHDGGLPALVFAVPINVTGCNPDDRFGAATGGCTTGYRQTFELPVAVNAGAAPTTVRASLVVDRRAEAGSMATDPAHEWRLGDIRSFTF